MAAVTTITTSMPHGLQRGMVIHVTGGRCLVVRTADAYSLTATPPRVYERLFWWAREKVAELRAWWAWKRVERKLRRGH